MELSLVLPGHGRPIIDHVSLIDERFRLHRRRAEKIHRLIASQPRTAHEIAQELWGNVAVTQAYLTLSEVLGHVDLLLRDGRVVEEERDGVALPRRVSAALDVRRAPGLAPQVQRCAHARGAVASPPSAHTVLQITHATRRASTIGDEQAGVAAVVDPRFEIDEYLELARYRGVSIAHVLETHNHADHVSGHGRLVAATGARIHVHRAPQPDYEHEPFDDGWELQLGSLTVRALHTPGHRPEHTAFLLDRHAIAEPEPWAVLSGDSLFVGDVARTDLAIEPGAGAREIFRSVHEQAADAARRLRAVARATSAARCAGAPAWT